MKNVYFYLIAVAAVILFIFIVYLIEYDDRVLWKNKMVRAYKEKDDPYIKGLTSNFELRYNLRWYEAISYLKKIEQIIEKVQDYERNKRLNH